MRDWRAARSVIAWLLFGSAIAMAGCSEPRAAADRRPSEPSEPGTPSCVTWRSEPRERPPGWDHVVIVRNGCVDPVECRIWSDVSPEPSFARLSPGERREVVLIRGANVARFRAHLACEASTPP